MLVLLSPAKSFKKTNSTAAAGGSQPIFLDEAEQLVDSLSKLSSLEIETLMSVNPEIAATNFERFKRWERPFHPGNSEPAILAFDGEVYRGLAADKWGVQDQEFAQRHLRILSGLYGVLRPNDLIQRYRLEMGCKLALNGGGNLYSFWGDRIARQLADESDGPIINLASNEYIKSVVGIKDRLIPCHFKDRKGDDYKTLMTYAKHARGAMARFIMKNRIDRPEGLAEFNENGYTFRPDFSDKTQMTFVRDEQTKS
jgi:hypothetical protein